MLLLNARTLRTNVKLPVAGGRRLLKSTSDETPVAEFLDQHLTPRGTSSPPTGTTTIHGEVLSLYRDVWRATRAFSWHNEQGVLWKDVLRLSARREFEAAQSEKDPEKIAKLVVVGRDAIRVTLEKFAQKQEVLVSDSAADPTRKPPSG